MGTYDPYAHAEQLGIEVIHRPLRASQGYWYPDHNLIVIRERLRIVHDRSALAHELAHAVLGHCESTPKHEVLADRLAAENMIDVDEFQAVARWATDSYQIARELGVSNRLVRVFLNLRRASA